ncbi:MAG: hypothetical protein GXP25_12290 [Planctomycetes bacterium]|nr:hypothetical protein [Planctomycetota bacterium]
MVIGTTMNQDLPKVHICGTLVLVALLSATLACACDLPVYRYALERWARDPCYFVCYASGEKSKSEAEIERILDQGPDDGFFANVYFKRVDVKEIDKLHERSSARKLWEQHKTDKLPLYVVTSPLGMTFYAGALTPQDLGPMLSSPKRKKIAERLCDDKLVFIFLRSGKAEKDKAAAAVLKQLSSSEVASEILAPIELDRKDPAETWLVRQLLAVENDLADSKDPMIFPVIGRGHVLPPYLGEGITKQNLEEAVMVLGGPCTCTVKAYLGGVDLLTNWNWEGAVYGGESGEAKPLPLGITLAKKDKKAPKPLPKVTPVKNTAKGKEVKQAQSQSEPTLESHVARNVAVVVGALVVLVGAMGIVMWRRSSV